MKLRNLILTLLTAIACAATSLAASPSPDWRGSMTPYPLDNLTPMLPDSLRPVGVIYVARHGARFLTSAANVDNLRRRLAGADAMGDLTPLGRKFIALLNTVEQTTGHNWGMLDSVGYREERTLGARMQSRMSAMLRSGVLVARSTYVPRAIMTMYTFVYRIAMKEPYLNIVTHEGPEQDSLLRFFDTDKAYRAYLKDGDWKPTYDNYVDSHIPTRPATALLGSETGLSDSQLRKITLEAYEIVRSLDAMGIDDSAAPFFTTDELTECWKASNLRHYLQRTANRCSDIAARAAAPLLRQVVDDMDQLTRPDNMCRGKMYFGHAETLMPLLSLMQVEGCNAPDAQPDEVWRHWDDSRIVPLGANLELDLARAPSGEIYVACYLNGTPTSPCNGLQPISPLNLVKAEWERILASFMQ